MVKCNLGLAAQGDPRPSWIQEIKCLKVEKLQTYRMLQGWLRATWISLSWEGVQQMMNLKTWEQFPNNPWFNKIGPDSHEQFVEPFTWFQRCGGLQNSQQQPRASCALLLTVCFYAHSGKHFCRGNVCPQIWSLKVQFFSEVLYIHALSGKDCPKWH
jgi:hypothetical protein